MELSDLIKKLRGESCLTLAQLSKATDISVGLLSEIENGISTEFKFKTIDKLASFFGSDRDAIYKLGGKIPADIYFRIVESKKSYSELREILNVSKV